MNRFAQLTGRQYQLFQYEGDPNAQRVIVLMGSVAEAVHETVDGLNRKGSRVGVVKVRRYRPFSAAHLLQSLPTTLE
jgi:pyruvate-ferredoxin/flavodoxin oxidoreductase